MVRKREIPSKQRWGIFGNEGLPGSDHFFKRLCFSHFPNETITWLLKIHIPGTYLNLTESVSPKEKPGSL